MQPGETKPSSPPKGFRPEPFEYHEQIELEIHALTNQGQGLGRIDNWVVFVPFSLPGERVRASVYRNHRNYSEADLVEVLAPSPQRVEPKCPLFGACGGCQYQHFAYEGQLESKRQQVEELLLHLAGLEQRVEEVIPSPLEYGYRSKITPHFQKPRDGALREIGFLKLGRRQQILDVEQCPIAAREINEALPGLREEVRRRASSFKKGATLLLRLAENGVITEPQAIAREKVGPLTFEFPAGEFFQNNPFILPAFTAHVAERAASGGMRFLVDAYCGSGLFALTAAHRFERVAGIEVSEKSIEWARHNARKNGIDHANFIHGKADAIFEETTGFEPAATAVVIDPPRKGSDERFLGQLLRFGPARIVYVSCNPATQMRDLKTLSADGRYRIDEVQPFDLFPQTKHLECIVTLSRDLP